MEKLTIKSSRWKHVLLLIASVGFVVAGVAMLAKGNWFGWVAIIFFGSGIPIFIWQIMDARPRLVIDERGVADRTLGVGRIDWGDIVAARVMSISGNDFISLELRDPEKYLSRLSNVKRAMASANRKLGFSDFNLNLSGVDAKTEEVFELLMKFCELNRPDAAGPSPAHDPGRRQWPRQG
ncbi:MAG TPA: STM3941 family protein [Pyrinomonadaceae bacterium]|nr:STM3941 family protein [Pyrinomonadaceae bacterium]